MRQRMAGRRLLAWATPAAVASWAAEQAVLLLLLLLQWACCWAEALACSQGALPCWRTSLLLWEQVEAGPRTAGPP